MAIAQAQLMLINGDNNRALIKLACKPLDHFVVLDFYFGKK